MACKVMPKFTRIELAILQEVDLNVRKAHGVSLDTLIDILRRYLSKEGR